MIYISINVYVINDILLLFLEKGNSYFNNNEKSALNIKNKCTLIFI